RIPNRVVPLAARASNWIIDGSRRGSRVQSFAEWQRYDLWCGAGVVGRRQGAAAARAEAQPSEEDFLLIGASIGPDGPEAAPGNVEQNVVADADSLAVGADYLRLYLRTGGGRAQGGRDGKAGSTIR